MSRSQPLSPTNPPLPIPQSLISTLQNRQSPWDDRVQALQQLCTLSHSLSLQDLHNPTRPLFLQQLRSLSPHFAYCLSDLRSILVKEACLCIETLAKVFGAEFVLTVGDDVIPALLSRSAQTTRVIRESAVNAAKCMFEHGVNGVSFFAARLLSRTVLDRKAPNLMRSTAAEFIGMILVEDCLSGLQVIGEAIQSAIIGGCQDAHETVRAISRENWRRFDALDALAANQMLTSMSPQVVALIQKEKSTSPRSTTSSAKSSPRSPQNQDNGVSRSNGPRRANPNRVNTDSVREDDDEKSPKTSPTGNQGAPKTLKPAQRAVKVKPPAPPLNTNTTTAITKKKRVLPPRPVPKSVDDSKAISTGPKSRKSTHPILARPPRRSVMPNMVIELNGTDAPVSKRMRPRNARRSVPVNMLGLLKEDVLVNACAESNDDSSGKKTDVKALAQHDIDDAAQKDASHVSPIAQSDVTRIAHNATSPAAEQVKGDVSPVSNTQVCSPANESMCDEVSKLGKPKRVSPASKRSELDITKSPQSTSRSLNSSPVKLKTSPTKPSSPTVGRQFRVASSPQTPSRSSESGKVRRFSEGKANQRLEESPSTDTKAGADGSRSHASAIPSSRGIASENGDVERVVRESGSPKHEDGCGSSPGSVISAENNSQFADNTEALESEPANGCAKGSVSGAAKDSGNTPKEDVASRKGRISYILSSSVSPPGFFSQTKVAESNSSISTQPEECSEESADADDAVANEQMSHSKKKPSDENSLNKAEATFEPGSVNDESNAKSSESAKSKARETVSEEQSDGLAEEKDEPTEDDIALLLSIGSPSSADVDAIAISEIVQRTAQETTVDWESLVRDVETTFSEDVADKSKEEAPSGTSSGRSEPASEKENEKPIGDADQKTTEVDEKPAIEVDANPSKKDEAKTTATRMNSVSQKPALPKPPPRKSVLPSRTLLKPPVQNSASERKVSSKITGKQGAHGAVSRRKPSVMPNSRQEDTSSNVSTTKGNPLQGAKTTRPKLGAPRRSIMPGTKIELKSNADSGRDAEKSLVTGASQNEISRVGTITSRMQVQKRKPLSPKVQGVVDWLKRANKCKSSGWQERCSTLEGFGEACKQLDGEQVGVRLAEDCVGMLGDYIQDMHHRVSSSALDGLFFLLLCSEGSSVAFQKALDKRDDVLRRILGLLSSSRENVRLAAGRVMQSFDVQFTPEIAVSLIMRAVSAGGNDTRRGGGVGKIVADGRVAEMGCIQLEHAFERASASGVGFVWKTTLLETVLRGMGEMKKDRRVAVRRGAGQVVEAVRKSLPPGAFELANEKYM